MPSNASTEENLAIVLERARTAGFLGPGPLRAHSQHALSFGHPIPVDAKTLLDLGSGGGVPGLPLFVRHPRLHGVLLDASEKRCAFLTWAVAELQLADRVDVRRGRAEDLGHDESLRSNFDVVTCRGFGPPAATIEGAVGFLRPGGILIISEPPEGRIWSAPTLSEVGLSQLAAKQIQANGRESSRSRTEDTPSSGNPVPAPPLAGEPLPRSEHDDLHGESLSESGSTDRGQSGADLGASVTAANEQSPPDESTQTARVVAFELRGIVPDNLPRPLRKQRSRPLKVLVSDE